MRTLFRTFLYEGEVALRRVKKFFSDYRYYVIMGQWVEPASDPKDLSARRTLRALCSLVKESWSYLDLLQLSFAARALPEGPVKMCAKSLEDHRKELTARKKTPVELLDRARAFAQKWAQRKTHPNDIRIRQLLASSSACFERTRKEGGLALSRLNSSAFGGDGTISGGDCTLGATMYRPVEDNYEAVEFSDEDDEDEPEPISLP
jgi:hypothetical protein